MHNMLRYTTAPSDELVMKPLHDETYPTPVHGVGGGMASIKNKTTVTFFPNDRDPLSVTLYSQYAREC